MLEWKVAKFSPKLPKKRGMQFNLKSGIFHNLTKICQIFGQRLKANLSSCSFKIAQSVSHCKQWTTYSYQPAYIPYPMNRVNPLLYLLSVIQWSNVLPIDLVVLRNRSYLPYLFLLSCQSPAIDSTTCGIMDVGLNPAVKFLLRKDEYQGRGRSGSFRPWWRVKLSCKGT